jgi:hypothetical protein
MPAQTVEERLSALEAEVARLKAQTGGERPGVIGRTRPDFLQNYTRRSENNKMFDEVAREVEAEREREREEARRLDDAETSGE